MINSLVYDAALASLCVIFSPPSKHSNGTTRGLPKKSSSVCSWSRREQINAMANYGSHVEVFCRRTFINSSWQLNGNWFCKNEKRSFKTIIQQGGLVSTMPEVSLWSLTALIFFSSSLGKMTSIWTFILAKQHDFRQSWTEFFLNLTLFFF